MSRKLLVLAALLAPVAGPVALAGPFGNDCGQSGCASGQCGSGHGAGHDCPNLHCPPRYHHCQERGPHPHFRHGCPRPVCGPCDLVNWGYYETCWRPWPFPTNWAHCPVPPYAAHVPEHPVRPPARVNGPAAGGNGGNGSDSQLPPPRKLDTGTPSGS